MPAPAAFKPSAYRLDLTIDPSKTRFAGHTEIDGYFAQPVSSIFLHGNGLKVSRVVVEYGSKTLTARYCQVDDTGVARVEFVRTVPAGAFTLKFVELAQSKERIGQCAALRGVKGAEISAVLAEKPAPPPPPQSPPT